MNQETFKLIITKPCNKNWDAMLQTNDGRHCNSCRKEVIDFSKMNDEEVKNYFIQNRATETCGRFYSNQLDRIQIHLPKNILQSDISHWKKYIIILMICFGINLFSVEVVLGQTTDSLHTKDSIKPIDTLKNNDSIKVDNTTKKPIKKKQNKKKYYYITAIAGGVSYYPYEPTPKPEEMLSQIKEKYTTKKLPAEKLPYKKQEPLQQREFIIPDEIKIRKRK